MADHRECQGCLDGCTIESRAHCRSCILEPWPCDAQQLTDHRVRLHLMLMDAAAEVHRYRGHPPYGSSFLDCYSIPCVKYRSALNND